MLIAELSFVQQIWLLVLGFALSSVAGAAIVYFFSQRGWERQTRIELYRRRYDEGVLFVDELSKLIGNRFFLLQRLLWAIREQDSPRMLKCAEQYDAAVVEWNSQFWMNRNKVRLFLGDGCAAQFLDYGDDERPASPQSVHYCFVHAHRLVLAAKNGPAALAEADAAVTRLNWRCSEFLESVTTRFQQRAVSLNLLEIPALPQSRSNAVSGKE